MDYEPQPQPSEHVVVFAGTAATLAYLMASGRQADAARTIAQASVAMRRELVAVMRAAAVLLELGLPPEAGVSDEPPF
ncbi:hypothetical protein [Streptomyces sp. 8K308]|uniref:hypothetical protein n=1 Tax=Streptomyces sp. 8K308 TaxID=2530388 RepID=UPI001053ECF8|nr:hypothetical protein [Streptomyces sp. 8K308]